MPDPISSTHPFGPDNPHPISTMSTELVGLILERLRAEPKAFFAGVYVSNSREVLFKHV